MRSFRLFVPVALFAAVHSAALATAVPAAAQTKPQPAQAKRDLIQQAQHLFDEQQYEESIQTLTAALVRPNNTKEQKVAIYRLLALNLITLNRKDEAESSVRGLLSIQPDYELPRSESPRFRDFFSSTKSKWEAEGRPGLVKEAEVAAIPVTMSHTSPSQVDAGTQIPLTVRLRDPQSRVVEVRLYYRTGSKGKFTDIDANLDAGSARAQVPGSAVKAPFVEYYFIGFDAKKEPIASRGDATAPLRIAVPESSSGWVLPLAIGGGLLGAGAIVGGLFLAGVFKGSDPAPTSRSSVSISFGE